MREVIQKWYEWLKQATSNEKKELAHIYSDGRQLWATDGYRLHARQVATDKQGQVHVGETGLFEVDANGQLPDIAAARPHTRPSATVIVERDKLLQALAGQDNHVRLTFYDQDQALELSSAGAYALVMPMEGLEESDFWVPEISTE
jgi:hypothetical protein